MLIVCQLALYCALFTAIVKLAVRGAARGDRHPALLNRRRVKT